MSGTTARWRAQARARWPQRARAAAVHTAGDALASWGWLHAGQMREANPLLAPLVEAWGAGAAMGLRATVGLAALAALAAAARAGVPRARVAVTAVWAVLQAVMVWHVLGAAAIWWATTGS